MLKLKEDIDSDFLLKIPEIFNLLGVIPKDKLTYMSSSEIESQQYITYESFL